MSKILLILLMCLVPFINAKAADSLDELLEEIRAEHQQEKKLHTEREQRFREERDRQKQLLEEAKAELAAEEKRSEALKVSYDQKEQEIQSKNELLQLRMGSLGELLGVVRQVAGDIDVVIDNSLVSAQKPGRDKILEQLSTSKALPEISELEQLWQLVLDEMVSAGKVVSFSSNIITNTGEQKQETVTRVGVFNAVTNGRFLRYVADTGQLVEPGKQPAERFRAMARTLENADTGIAPFPLDPTRGSMLALLVQVPDLKTRVRQGGIVGIVIIFIGLVGLLITLERFTMLGIINSKVKKQMQSDTPDNNPLGRIMSVYQSNPDVDTETLELKLDEAILKEIPALKRGLGILALLAAIAPLLGLLGTVTGIIETFQSITLFGTGDPRVMSGGISQALVTTVMGLVVAIPLLLFHSFLTARSNRLVHLLDEKSAAYVAMLAEANRK